MTCTFNLTTAKPARLGRTRFNMLQNGQVVRHWFQRGWEMRNAAREECFEPFIFTWIAINAWGECVTNQEKDDDWVRSLSLDSELNRQFTGYLDDPINQGRESADLFRGYWPIPRVQAWRRYPGQYPQSNTVHDRARFFSQKNIPCAPKCALQHFDAGQEIPLDWEHFLPSVYRVRCNLFHGEKSPYDPGDAIIVQTSFLSLVKFMKTLDYFSRDARY